jgi:hypothetical protein
MKIISTSFVVMLLLFCNRCNVIDHDPVAAISPNQLFTNLDDAQAAVYGAYAALLNPGYIGGRFTALPEVPTKNTTATTANDAFNRLNKLLFDTNNEAFDMIWKDIYTGINRVNLIIEKLPSLPLHNLSATTKKEQLLAEARFLRAFHYFNLIQLFGDVPLITSYYVVANVEELKVARSSTDSIYELIFNDLEFAETNLPTTYTTLKENKGRATTLTAKALLTRIFLYQKKYKESSAKANEILQRATSSLPSYSSLSTEQLTNEAIWEIQFNDLSRNDLVYYYLPTTLGGRGWLTPSEDLLNAYEQGDLRKEATVRLHNDQYYVHKYFRINTGTDNIIIFRLAEILLSRAEALAEVSYPNDESINLLNIIRIRAGLSLLTIGNLPDIESFRQAVWKERRLELAFEGHEWHDLVRTNRLSTVMGLTDPNKYIFPLPEAERRRNQKLSQNPGY